MLSVRELFIKHQAQTTDSPLSIRFKDSTGVYLIDENGKKHIDFISGIGVSNYGHGNKEVINAIKEQAEKHMHLMVYGEFISDPPALFAHELTKNIKGNLDCVYFVNSGAEAIEGAMKLAKRFTGRSKFIAAKNAYHGSTQGALSLMSAEYFKQNYRPLLPGVEFINYNSTEDLEIINEEFAAVVIEGVQAESGYLPGKKAFFQALRKKCDENGVLLIIDEIQTGMGRTGHLFSYEDLGIIPDIICSAKALGAGMPLGAFISSKKLMDSLSNNPILGHITTFGGHPVSCAAGLAGFKFMLENELISQVKSKSEFIFNSINPSDKIKSIQGKGLMISIEFENFEINKKIIDLCIEKGLITDWFLHAPNKLRISPPLTISRQELEQSLEIINECIKIA